MIFLLLDRPVFGAVDAQYPHQFRIVIQRRHEFLDFIDVAFQGCRRRRFLERELEGGGGRQEAVQALRFDGCEHRCGEVRELMAELL